MVTAGEPSGIGPDLVVLLAQESRSTPWCVVADGDMLMGRAHLLGVPLRILPPDQPTTRAGEINVDHVPLRGAVRPGTLNVANAEYVVATLSAGLGLSLRDGAPLVTAPVHKGVINDSGFAFSGHTEFLRDACGVEDVVMLLVADSIKVALATTHLPLRDVADAITLELLERRLRILHQGLVDQFGLTAPRVLVAGLNPHAGEGGHLGREEIDVIQPVITRCQDMAGTVTGPYPADTLFTPALLAQGDAVLAMYHDQGLPALKALGFGNAVNVTLGLPVIRTSVDHGTALDRAGRGGIELGSMRAALTLAQRLSDGSRA